MSCWRMGEESDFEEAGKFCKLQIEWGMDKVSNLEFGRD